MSGEIPTYDRAELERLQLERLRDTLSRVYDRVPHYTRAFDEAGVRPDDLTSLADLGRFPFTRVRRPIFPLDQFDGEPGDGPPIPPTARPRPGEAGPRLDSRD